MGCRVELLRLLLPGKLLVLNRVSYLLGLCNLLRLITAG